MGGKFLKNKQGFDMPFSWLFAIIVGAVIIFLAIYATSQFVDTAKRAEYSGAAVSIGILLSPLETGIASAVGDRIDFDKQTITYYKCYEPSSTYNFGRQTIKFSEQSGIGKEWANHGAEITITNKFIFSDSIEEGKNLYLFSKPFYAGFKVTDLIFISSEEYCFVAPPDWIEDEMQNLNLKNINITDSINDCVEEDVKVCFGGGILGCNMSVYSEGDNFEEGYVVRDGEMMDYFGSLIYGAIFADSDTYNCNIVRVGSKISALASVYDAKADFVANRGCTTDIQGDLGNLYVASGNIESSADIIGIQNIIEIMDEKNEDASCRLYPGEEY